MNARTLSIALGALLALGGGYVLLKGGSFTSSRDVIDVGGLTISAEEQHPIRPWVGGLGLALGVVLIAGGLTRSR